MDHDDDEKRRRKLFFFSLRVFCHMPSDSKAKSSKLLFQKTFNKKVKKSETPREKVFMLFAKRFILGSQWMNGKYHIHASKIQKEFSSTNFRCSTACGLPSVSYLFVNFLFN
jgi:hypothetical protein